MNQFGKEGFNIVHNDEEASQIVDLYWGNGYIEMTKEELDHLLNGGTLVEVINQEYTTVIKLKS